MSSSSMVAAPLDVTFCSTCTHWVGSRELRAGYCITGLMEEGICVRDAEPDESCGEPPRKPAREFGCERWCAMPPEADGTGQCDA